MYSPWQYGYDDAAILGITNNPYDANTQEYWEYERGNKAGWKNQNPWLT